jgi:UDP-arabinose 4-epimerase
MNTVVVVGGAGYIGSHICKALKIHGFLPVVYDNMSQGHPWALKWGPIADGDLLNSNLIEQALNEFQPVGVIHLAAFHNVRESGLQPEKYYTNNVQGTLTLLKAMKRTGIDSLVFSSSAAVYGNPLYSPIDEEHPKNPLSPYGRTKWFTEQILTDFSDAQDLRSVSLRYFNAAGADLDVEIGEAHEPETHLIPLAILAALGEKPPLTIFGEDHPTPDGTPIRDYIHVADLAEAHVLSLKWLLRNKTSITLNLGSGKGFSVKEVIETTEDVIGLPVPRVKGERSMYDPPVLVANSSKAAGFLKWTPCYSDLKTIIESAYRWHKTQALSNIQPLI